MSYKTRRKIKDKEKEQLIRQVKKLEYQLVCKGKKGFPYYHYQKKKKGKSLELKL